MKRTISLVALIATCCWMTAQPLTYERYNSLVAEKNILYLTEKYNVEKAAAAVQAAKVFNDPELSVEYGNNQDWNLQMGQSVELGLSINPDFAGVRRARMAVAGNEKDISEASLKAYLSNLKLEAAQAWAQAWMLRESCAILEETVADMIQIAQCDSLRLKVGDVGKADALQSSLEAKTLKGELVSLKAEYLNALNTLALFCGGGNDISVDGELPPPVILPSESEICSLAEANRADLKAAVLSKTLSENNLKLVRASRSFEMGINLGYSYNTEVRNEIAPAPKYNGFTVGVSIPLKFSSCNKGEMNAARAQVLQSEKCLEAARLQVRSEALQAYNSLLAAMTVQHQYSSSILNDARSIVQGRKEGYIKGENSLIEMLSAQHTYLGVMQAYIEACSECFVCKARLEQAVGCPLSD